MNSADQIKSDQIKDSSRSIIKKYAVRSNAKAAFQCLNTLAPYLVLFYLAMNSLANSLWLTAVYILLLTLLTVRIFMVMHDAGHLCLIRTRLSNILSGFFTGVPVGMPQHVWSQHHNYHHATNGNWQNIAGR